MTHNHAGFPGGIAGAELLDRMRAQAMKYGTRLVPGAIERLVKEHGNFVALGKIAPNKNGRIVARSVLLATGVVNNRPQMPDALHDEAVARGLLRYCPICDGYEVRDRRIAVLGAGECGAKEALFLRSYSADITLISPDGATALPPPWADRLAGAAIVTVDGPCKAIAIDDTQIRLSLPQENFSFDTLYPALGSVIRSELAGDVGASRSEDGCLLVDAHQRTSVAGLYAAGDVVLGLDQISHAMGEGGVAATTIRNDLAERSPLYRAAHH